MTKYKDALEEAVDKILKPIVWKNPMGIAAARNESRQAANKLFKDPVIKEALSKAEQFEWNSNMDEAPRDGTKLLGFLQTGEITTIWYNWQADDWETEHWLLDDGYLPTHWMTLPPPPTS